MSEIEASSQVTTSFYHYKKVSLVLKYNRPMEVSCHRLCAVFSETEIISRISYKCFDRTRRFNISYTSVNYSLRRSSPKTTEAMRLKCLKEQYKRMRKHHVDCREHQEKANLFRAQLEKTSKDVEMIIAIAKQEVSDTTEYVVTKTQRRDSQKNSS